MKYSFLFLLLPVLFFAGCGSSSPSEEANFYGDKALLEKLPPKSASASAMPDSTNTSSLPTNTMNLEIDQNKNYTAILYTSLGNIEIALHATDTPKTANNFVSLARKDFYDNTIFHRVIKGFMIQGGDPNGNGTGGPGYTFKDESFEGAYDRGVVAMANRGPNTNGSQFFIMHADYPLPKNYVIFGHVVSGMEVVDAIAESPVQPGGEGSRPVTPVVVQNVEIVESE